MELKTLAGSPANAAYEFMTDAAITDDEDTSVRIPFAAYRNGSLYVKSGSVATITWWTCAPDGTVYQCADNSGNAITTTVDATEATPIPAALIGFATLVPVGDVAGVADIFLKA